MVGWRGDRTWPQQKQKKNNFRCLFPIIIDLDVYCCKEKSFLTLNFLISLKLSQCWIKYLKTNHYWPIFCQRMISQFLSSALPLYTEMRVRACGFQQSHHNLYCLLLCCSDFWHWLLILTKCSFIYGHPPRSVIRNIFLLFARLGPEERPILSQWDRRMGRRVVLYSSVTQPASQPPGPPNFSKYSKWNNSSTLGWIFLKF